MYEGDLSLQKMQKIPVRRHVKVNNEHRVYNKESQDYWEKREYQKAKNSIMEETITNKLFINQKGKCTHCKGSITQHDIVNYRVHKHHVIPKSQGRENRLDNPQFLHSECHTEINSRGENDKNNHPNPSNHSFDR